MAATLSYQANDTDSGTIGGGSTYTFSLTVASAAGQERLVAIGGIGANAATCDYSGCTVDGQTGTRVGTVSRGADDGGNTAAFVTFFRATGTSGTTISVVATYSAGAGGSCFAGFCACWTLSDADTVLDTQNTAGNDPNISLDTAAGGTAAGALVGYSDGTLTATWAGLTEHFDAVTVFGDDIFTAASLDTAGASTPLTVTVDIAAGMVESVAAMAVSFNPDAGGAAYNAVPLLDHYYRMISG